MAWQTPKLDWSVEDGVRDEDLNRIEGNINELRSTSALATDTTIYVATTGNDVSGAGTSASPYGSITRALADLPKNLNGKAVTIHVSAGTYNESVNISGFSCGSLTLSGPVNASVTISNLTITSSVVNLLNIQLTTGTCLITTGASFVSTTAVLRLNGGGINVTGCSKAHILDAVINNAYTAAQAINASVLNIANISGAGNTYGMYVSGGSVIAYGTSMLFATTPTYTNSGGRILTGTGNNSGGGGVLADAEIE